MDHARMIAGEMARICDAHGAAFVFKASFDKANRTSLSGERRHRHRRGAAESCRRSRPNSAARS